MYIFYLPTRFFENLSVEVLDLALAVLDLVLVTVLTEVLFPGVCLPLSRKKGLSLNNIILTHLLLPRIEAGNRFFFAK